jgi:hypothetical protein
MISGFTLVKDALEQLYTFVEVTASALTIYEDLSILEGY